MHNKKASPYAFDLMRMLNRNPAQKELVINLVDELNDAEYRLANGEPAQNRISDLQTRLIKACNYNVGMLTPWLFPTYPDDTPLSLMERPYMFTMFALSGNTQVTLRAGRQIGKCVTGDAALEFEDGDRMSIQELFEMV